MYLIYFDSAGNTGTNYDDLQQPFYTMVGLVCHDLKWQSVDSNFTKIIDNYLPGRDKANFEVHAVELYRAKGVWRSLGIEKCKSLIYDLLDLLVKHDLKLVYCTLSKAQLKEIIKESEFSLDHPSDMTLFFLSQMIEKFLRKQGSEVLGMLIGDKEKEIEETLCDSLNHYRSLAFTDSIKEIEKSGAKTSFQLIERIIETIHFVDSHKSSFIQLTDLCTYFINRYYFKGQNTSPYLEKIKSCIIEKKEVLS